MVVDRALQVWVGVFAMPVDDSDELPWLVVGLLVFLAASYL